MSERIGEILYRGLKRWLRLPPGPEGYKLTSHGEAAPTWEAEAGAASLIHQASVTLTDAQIKSLFPNDNVPVTIVPGPGADRLLVFAGGFISLDVTAGGYLSDDDLSLVRLRICTNADDSLSLAWRANILYAGVQRISLLPDFFESSGRFNASPYSIAANYSMRLQIDPTDTASNPLTAGHVDNTMIVVCDFRVLDVTTGRYLTTAESGWDEDTRTFP
jgi:hypothetical protein